MALTRDQLDTYDANSQNEFVLRAADRISGYGARGSDIFVDWPLHPLHTLGVVNTEEVKATKNQYIQDGGRYVMAKVVEAVPQIQNWADAVQEFVSSMIDFLRNQVGDALGWQSDKKALAENFAKNSGQITQEIHTLAIKEGVDPTSLMSAMASGMKQATSSLDAIQEELRKEGKKAVSQILRTQDNTAAGVSEDATLAAAGETYRQVYRAALSDLRGKRDDYDTNEQTRDTLRNKAHAIAAQISGMHYDGEKQELVATRDANGNHGGMLAYIHDSIVAIDEGKQPTIAFALAPAASQTPPQAPAVGGQDVSPGDSLPAPPPNLRGPAASGAAQQQGKQ